MRKIRVTIITQNFNSAGYLQLSMLSLFSAFATLRMLRDIVIGRIILIDNASSDDSFAKLCRLGTELSRENNIDFECIQLEKDLGNSFAISYGFLLERRRGTKYVINIDNDFVILSPNVVKDMIMLAQLFDRFGVKYHSIAPFHIVRNRDRFLKSLSCVDKTSCEITLNHFSNASLENEVLALNIAYVDVLNRPVTIYSVIDQREFYSAVKKVGSLPKFFISAFLPATFTLYNTDSAPVPPFFYILGDDISSGLEHSKRGYINVVLPSIGGIHYVASSHKINKIRFYFGFRNYLLENPSTDPNRMLLKSIFLTYSMIYSILYAVNLRKPLKRKFSPHYKVLSKTFHEESHGPEGSKHAILGALHAILKDKTFRRKIDDWTNKYVSDTGRDLLNHLRLDFTTWSNGTLSIRNLVMYLLLPDKMIRKETSSKILERRLKRKVSDSLY